MIRTEKKQRHCSKCGALIGRMTAAVWAVCGHICDSCKKKEDPRKG